MANIKVKDADGSDKYLKASGAGSDGDPFVPEQAIISNPSNWAANENNATAQTNNPIVSAPGIGNRLCLKTFIFSTDTAMSITLVEDPAGTPVTIAGPFYFAANGGIAIPIDPPKKLSENKALGYTSSAVGNHTIFVSGYTEEV